MGERARARTAGPVPSPDATSIPVAPRFASPAPHAVFAAIGIALAAGASLYYAGLSPLEFQASGQRWLGWLSALGFLSAYAYSARKRLGMGRFRRIRSWYVAHAWLTLAGLVIGLLHAAFRFGGAVEGVLLVGFGLAVGSGLTLALVHERFKTWIVRLETEHLLPEDLLELRAARATEVAELLAANRPELEAAVRQGVVARLRGFRTSLSLLRSHGAPSELQATLEKQLPLGGLSKAEQDVLRRVLSVEIERKALGLQTSLHRLRSGWVTAHIIGSTGVLVLLALHVALVWYF